MQVETLKDIIDWTWEFHQHLAACMQHCAGEQPNERAKLLLDYLSEHEQQLSRTLKTFEDSGNAKALNTWCLEYLDKHPIKPHGKCEKPFAEMNTEEIIEEIERQHQQIIELYRYLSGREVAPSAAEMLEQLVALETHEAMRMAHSANRLEDL